MTLILTYGADLLMILASTGAAIYCLILSRRLSRLTSFDKGIGGAIAVLSAQVDDMKSALSEAKAGSDGASGHLNDLVRQARDISVELEMMIAACHDFAEEALVVQGPVDTPPAQAAAMSTPSSPVSRPEVDGTAEAPADLRAMLDLPARHDTPDDDGAPEAEAGAVPVFGSRRAAHPTPLFTHRARAGA